jgi:hypothetical protein
VAGGRAWGCRGPNSIARRRTPCQAASVRGQSNQELSEVLRAGRASTAGLSPLSTPDSYSRWTDRSVHLCSKTVRATFMAHGSSVMRPLSSGIPPAVYNSWGTCDLTVHASPLWDIAPSRQGAGSSAYAALLRPITCTSPSARQPIRGITPGLCFLRDPSRHAMRLAPAHHDG